jgi:hypothetical protein
MCVAGITPEYDVWLGLALAEDVCPFPAMSSLQALAVGLHEPGAP